MGQPRHHIVKIIEQCSVSPPPDSVPPTSIPLTFFDLPWFYLHPIQRIFFYELPQPTTTNQILQTVVPTLKHSLSLTLQHFFPFAGNILVPLHPGNFPHILYSDGDSVSFTVAESHEDFNYFVANAPTHLRDLNLLAPVFPSPLTTQDGGKLLPLMAVQITVLPNYGFSMCVGFNHVVADGRAFHHFIKFWASVCRTRGEDMDSVKESLQLPLHNRDAIEDWRGLKLVFLEELSSSFTKIVKSFGILVDIPSNKVRFTFTLSREQVEKIKKWIYLECKKIGLSTESLIISTYVVTCSLLWVCMVKHYYTNTDAYETCKFTFPADCRNCGELSIPSTYFGNCLSRPVVELEKGKLVVENGIVEAAIAIESKIREFKCDGLKEIEDLMTHFNELGTSKECRVIAIGSAKHGVYETDFGWGKPKKSDVIHVLHSRIFSLCDSKDDNGVEIGLTLERSEIENFNTIVKEHITSIVGCD
ncbi:anthocyanin 5-aromatic acyltransferase-like [Arachis stenosperma]|uniref:anthocyanin 5-aromatic acyltransferase-like n=1 Tax=Arachis stenosperma TaxID=217475 RepID=UPI0025AB9CB1|nr:anthocyanin 5-aromatic acyltransferase-like [Arachis stenosperma]